MKKNNDYVVTLSKAGELLRPHLHMKAKTYKPDNWMLTNIVTGVLTIGCVGIDVAFFYALFAMISFDRPFLIVLQCAGIAYAADILSAYLGLYAKRYAQNLVHAKWILFMFAGVILSALAINVYLRVATVELFATNGVVDKSVWATTFFGCAVPLFTSVGNFITTFFVYDPLSIKKETEESILEDYGDIIRRLESVSFECEKFLEKDILEEDKALLDVTKKDLLADVLMLCDQVNVELMKHMASPGSTNVLSFSLAEKVKECLEEELAAK